MKITERTATRDKERTRRAILDAAERTFSERGANVSLGDIAAVPVSPKVVSCTTSPVVKP